MSDQTPQTVIDARDPRGEFPFALPEYIAHMVTVITRYRDGQVERVLQPFGLTLSRHRALLVIQRLGPCTMTELAEFSIVERTTLTRTVDQLVEAGLVARESRGADRRKVLLTVTEAGLALERRVTPAIWALNQENLEGIPEEDQRAFIRMAQGLVANLAPDAVARERALTFSRPKGRGSIS